jgi:hypothetical protein
MAMKRSSARRARRWIIHELTRSLDQLSYTAVRVSLSSDGNTSDGDEKSGLSDKDMMFTRNTSLHEQEETSC